ncbi:MAG TPA: DHH family phosphoesterase [Nitrososphaera sp.]|jgi:RecJ-like exonuclease|nr:DHH family phosphoesterase [Nitrososphaera sp.]
MSSNEKLSEALRNNSEKIRTAVENGNEISVVTHIDADGITSGSIIASALSRLGARFSVRAVPDMNASVIEKMMAEARDFYIITDLGGGWALDLRKALGDKWLIVDHHEISKEEIMTDDGSQILNAWKFAIDGGKQVSAGGMAYLVANAIDRKNRDLARLAVVSAVGDRQDQGEKKSFMGLNSEILKTAESLGLVKVDLDIMLVGRETRPLHEALAFTSDPYIEGLTWDREACRMALMDSGLKLKDKGRWRVLAEFSQEEKSAILDAVAKHVATSGKGDSNIVGDLIGYVYTLVTEETRSQLRDARGFSTMLNACGRIGKSGVGIAICMGDRYEMLSAGEEILGTYRTTLRNYITTIFADKWRIADDGRTVFVNGDGLVAEDMLGAVSSLLSGSPTLGQRLVFVRTLASDGTYKFSSRKTIGATMGPNLGIMMRHVAETCGGTGGGHSAAAGCRIPSNVLDSFIARVKAATNDPHFAASS